MTQAQHTQTATVSSLPFILAALATTALVAVAVVATQVLPLRIDATGPSRSYAIDAGAAWEAERDVISGALFPQTATAAEQAWEQKQAEISGATYGDGADDMRGVLRRQAQSSGATHVHGTDDVRGVPSRQAAVGTGAGDAGVDESESRSPRTPIAR
jgi:hypothetical protein